MDVREETQKDNVCKVSRVNNILRDKMFNIEALIFMIVLAFLLTALGITQNPDNIILGIQPGIWIDVCVTWAFLVIFFICLMNLQTATNGMIVFAMLVWLASFSSVSDGLSYIVDRQPGMEFANYIFSTCTFMIGPIMAYIFMHFVVIEKNCFSRPIVNTIKIFTVAFIIDMVIIIGGCLSGNIFTVQKGNVYQAGIDYILFVYPLAQLIASLIIILTGREFDKKDKVILSLFTLIPIFSTLYTETGNSYYSVHHALLLIIMLLMYGMQYTKKSEDGLRKDLERREAEALENQRRVTLLRGLASDYQTVYLLNYVTGEYETYGTNQEYQEKVVSKMDNTNDFFRDTLKNVSVAVHEGDWDNAVEFFSRENITRVMNSTGSASQDIRIIIDGEPAWYREKLIRLEGMGSSMCIAGMMDISEERKKELEQQKNMYIIEALSGDFDYVTLVSLGDDVSQDKITEYRTTHLIEKNVPEWKEDMSFADRMKLFRDRILQRDDYDHFNQQARRPVIMENLKERGVHYINFRAILDHHELYYQMKFMPTLSSTGEIDGFVVGVHNVDAETRREMEVREQIERIVRIQTDELKDKNESLNRMNEGIVELLGNITEGRDDESGVHVQSVKKYSYILARQVKMQLPEYGLKEKDINLISYLSALHDVGKIAIPDRILQKPGKLTDEEFEIMKTHCEKGVQILRNMTGSWSSEYLETSMNICKYHHEKWDGKGYPEGLMGDQIPICAQIVSVADCFDALTTERVYKGAYEPEIAIEMILKGECGAFSDKLMNCLTACREAFVSCVEGSGRSDVNISLDEETENEKVKAFENVKILLVEDDELSREINTDILSSEGAIVTTAADGIDSVEIFMESDGFDMILMDMVMPGMNGIEATRQIRKIEAERMAGPEESVPVIMLTAQRTEEKEEESINAGADVCLSKPLLAPELLRAMMVAVKKRSDYMEEKLRNTEIKVNTDALTGVKNITAYTDKVSELTGKLGDEDLEFAIVMCDINNLKFVNDTYGHDTGDIYIKNCCRIICQVFAHSPVYRIGGDEFVAVLQGNDYVNANGLISDLKVRIVSAMNIANYEDGKASLAAGIARFNPVEDKNVGDVIKRADMSMYRNKKQMK